MPVTGPSSRNQPSGVRLVFVPAGQGKEVSDESGDVGWFVQGGEVAAVMDRGGAGGGYGPAVGVSLVVVRPVVVAVGEGQGDLDGRVAVASGDLAVPVAGQRAQSAAVTGPLSAVVELVDQLRAQVAGVVESAFEHPAEHAFGPGLSDDRSDEGQQDGGEHDVADGRAAPDPAPAAVVVGIEGDDAGNPAAVPGGEAEPDRRPDGLAHHDDAGHVKAVEECFDGVGEVGGGVVGRWRAGVAVTGQVDGDQFDAGIAKLVTQGVEVFELHAQRVQQHDGPPVAVSVIAHADPVDVDRGRAAGGPSGHRITSATALG